MADLDDFFKKRDKKKKTTTKAKFSTLDITDEFAKQIEVTMPADGFFETSAEVLGGGVETTNGIESTLTSATTVTLTPAFSSSGGNTGPNDGNLDEEWKPFDSDENKDYSGLRINQNWKIEDEEEDNEDNDADDNERKVACPWGAGGLNQQQQSNKQATMTGKQKENNDENDESNNDKNNSDNKTEISKETDNTSVNKNEITATTSEATTTSTPSTGAYLPPHMRNKTTTTSSETNKTTTATTTSTVITTTPSSSGGAYVPPHLRNSSSNSSSGASFTVSTGGRKSNKAQPNINDTFEFPTLDAAVTPASSSTSDTNPKAATNDEEKFEMAKKGARVEAKSGGGMIDLENKFASLSNN